MLYDPVTSVSHTGQTVLRSRRRWIEMIVLGVFGFVFILAGSLPLLAFATGGMWPTGTGVRFFIGWAVAIACVCLFGLLPMACGIVAALGGQFVVIDPAKRTLTHHFTLAGFVVQKKRYEYDAVDGLSVARGASGPFGARGGPRLVLHSSGREVSIAEFDNTDGAKEFGVVLAKMLELPDARNSTAVA